MACQFGVRGFLHGKERLGGVCGKGGDEKVDGAIMSFEGEMSDPLGRLE